jgi:hypothetical protein
MPNSAAEILDRNFILKRIGDILYLPCEHAIWCKAPLHFPTETYVMCRTYRFDEESGRLFLACPTGRERWTEHQFRESVDINSHLILSLQVKEFVIINRPITTPPPSRPYKPKYDRDPDDWTPASGKAYPPSARNIPPGPPPPVRTWVNEQRSIPIMDIEFEPGKITFSLFINSLLGSVAFEITHTAIQKEWDSVKDYFAKVLHSKEVACHIHLEAIDSDIISKSAQLLTDDIIDGSLLEKVQNYVIQSKLLENENEISIVDEELKPIIEVITKRPIEPEWLLDKLNQLRKSKHYDHLRHLASMQDADAFRLRITGKPVSFIFVIKGMLGYFLVWETYETEEATYLWKLESADQNNRHQELAKLLETIKWLRDKHKMEYIRSAPANFERIDHDYLVPHLGLESWKGSLAAYIGEPAGTTTH